ncbi:hypothetical protein SBOR_3977 [Sclerotinia borealis F-4128]|uniref:Secreted protein n=1 Tax=Sclerotinia borealis (strain F-4128) TaxID=1432307 RepID=W9CLT7_SCLBF|nr:hypothetical protein SBOR_3977 [Sclerotinia borealis F-4128]
MKSHSMLLIALFIRGGTGSEPRLCKQYQDTHIGRNYVTCPNTTERYENGILVAKSQECMATASIAVMIIEFDTDRKNRVVDVCVLAAKIGESSRA